MSEKTIGQILHRIQKELKAPKANKNTFGNYSYRSAEDILEAVKKCLQEGEFVTCSDWVEQIGERYYVRAEAKLTYGNGELASMAFAREEETKKGMDAAQITGSASSYARKYALNGLFAIDDTKDADSMDNTKEEKKEAKVDKSRSNELVTLAYQCADDIELDSFLDQYGREIEELEYADTVNQAIEYRRGQIKNDIHPPIKHSFAGVDDQRKWVGKMLPVIKSIKSIAILDQWETQNLPFIKGLSEKPNKDGVVQRTWFKEQLKARRTELENVNTLTQPIG